ncbi:MAG TPA: hypothetical protein PKM25_00560 [Candidatus Ozemobacteraceae bacterium]|nr:hypothetical protein [Candidatus Ozemobacteraceae bacterium]
MNGTSALRVIAALVLAIFIAGAAHAATYGYVVVKGKSEEALDREVTTIERLIKGWDKGELLFKHKVANGIVFFKKYTVTLIFAGLEKDVTPFLSSGPYEGDFVKDVVAQFAYSSKGDPQSGENEVTTVLTKKFPNIRNAVAAIKGKTDTGLWTELKTSNAKTYQKHLLGGKLVDPKINVVFYSLKAVEENRIFSITFGEGSTRALE